MQHCLFKNELFLSAQVGGLSIGEGRYNLVVEGTGLFLDVLDADPQLYFSYQENIRRLQPFEDHSIKLSGNYDGFTELLIIADGGGLGISSSAKSVGRLAVQALESSKGNILYDTAQYVYPGINGVSHFPCSYDGSHESFSEASDISIFLNNQHCILRSKKELDDITFFDQEALKVGVVMSMLSSKHTTWSECYQYLDETLVSYRYYVVRQSSQSNEIDLFAKMPKEWKQASLERLLFSDNSPCFYETGFYSLVENYAKGGSIDESYFFRHFAPLDYLVNGLLPDTKLYPLQIKGSGSSKRNLFSGLRKVIRTYLNGQDVLGKKISKSSDIDGFAATFTDNFSYNLKQKLNFLFSELGLADYFEKNESAIFRMVEVRNKLLHEGWLRKGWHDEDFSITEHSFRARELGQLLLAVTLGLEGDYTSFIDKNFFFSVKCSENGVSVSYCEN